MYVEKEAFNDNETIFIGCASSMKLWAILITLENNFHPSTGKKKKNRNKKSALEFCHLINSIIRDLTNLITLMVAKEEEQQQQARCCYWKF